MKIIKPSVEILGDIDGEQILKHIEKCGRVCYKSEDKITADSAKTFVSNIIKRGHESVLEHQSISVRFVVDRGISHEIVRHRISSFSQESTRYCNYSQDRFNNEITVIKPCWWADEESEAYKEWYSACKATEHAYFEMLNCGCSPQEARTVLPNSLKTELIMTANLREWRHFLKLRTAQGAHPQMREVACELLQKMKQLIPTVFEDINGAET